MPFITLSVTEAEIADAVDCAQDLLYAMHILKEMKLKVRKPMIIYVDNKAAVNMILNWISGGRTRHTAVRINFLRELHEAGTVELRNIAGDKNPSDIKMKNSPKAVLEKHSLRLHGQDQYYKAYMETANDDSTKWDGVAGLSLSLDLDEPFGEFVRDVGSTKSDLHTVYKDDNSMTVVDNELMEEVTELVVDAF